ncbi:hypothetical protein BC629DRAFT_1590608 [Irpex lacteus]|nr:hypothetical protein BC629DRAFT_1590608 [Irpex lacteus]
MSTAWLPTHTWSHLVRARLNLLPWSTQVIRLLPQKLPSAKTFFNSSFSAQEHPSLIEMRNRPYPTTGWDTSLFEDGASEGVEPIPVNLDSDYTHRPCDILVRAVAKGHYEEARIIRAELGEMGVHIQPNELYEEIAVKEAFSMDKVNGDLPTFVSWWSLVPRPNIEHPIWKSHVFRARVLAKCTIENAHEILVSALHAVYRGHASMVGRLIVPQAIESAPLTFVLAFLEDLRSAEDAFLSTRFTGEELAETARTNHSRLYNQVIELLTRKERDGDAAKVLIEADKLSLQLSLKACKQLASALRMRQSMHLFRVVRSITVKQGLVFPDHSYEYSIADDYDLRHNLAWIHATLQKGNLPPAQALKGVMYYCYSSGNYHALEAIRRAFHSHEQGHAALVMWARVEMLCFMHMGQKDAAISVFFKYFQAIGVPMPHVIRRIQEEFRQRKNHDPARLQLDPCSEFFIPVHLRVADPMVEAKLTPTKFHNIFVWQALARMCTRQSLPSLYDEFLRVVESSQTPNDATDSPSDLFDAAHFNHFIHLFHSRHLSQLALGVLEDMKRLNVTPDLETYTTLLKGLKGEPYRTQTILREVREVYFTHGRTGPALHFRRGERGIARIPGTKHITAMLVLFASSLQTSLDHGHLTSAAWIYKELGEIMMTKPQRNRIVEAAMIRFEEAWKENGTRSKSSVVQSEDSGGARGSIESPSDRAAESPVSVAVHGESRKA